MAKRKQSKSTKPDYGTMNADALATATKQFDQPLAINRAKPMNAAQRARWENAVQKLSVGRPQKPKDEKFVRVLMTLEPKLLKQADSAAKKQGLSRSELVAKSLRSILRVAR